MQIPWTFPLIHTHNLHNLIYAAARRWSTPALISHLNIRFPCFRSNCCTLTICSPYMAPIPVWIAKCPVFLPQIHEEPLASHAENTHSNCYPSKNSRKQSFIRYYPVHYLIMHETQDMGFALLCSIPLTW